LIFIERGQKTHDRIADGFSGSNMVLNMALMKKYKMIRQEDIEEFKEAGHEGGSEPIEMRHDWIMRKNMPGGFQVPRGE